MKKWICFTLILCFTVSINAQNRRKKKRNSNKSNSELQAIKISPLGFIFDSYNISYERASASDQTFTLDLHYTNFKESGSEVSGIGFGGGYRFYIDLDDYLNGWFVGPKATISFLNYTLANTTDLKTTLFELAFIGGKQWKWDTLTLEVFTGPSITDFGEAGDSYPGGESVFGITGGISVGYAF
ncbi:DUF3575 domain-containing protein [Flavobacteriaceae bacterium]|nr:DUF3575 domain-containing protein [Flavobacteriaceae bacterium]